MPSLWIELRDMIMLWVEQGVKLFRVDNPHTKPFPFWEWLIEDVRREHPDVVFLSEAFTKPKVMYRLAKIGFSQSYTYFTWRNTKYELTEYLTELTTQPPKEFLPAALLRQHARHQPGLPAERPAFGLPDPRRPGDAALGPLGHVQRLRTLRGPPRPEEEGICRQREVPAHCLGLGPARQHHRRDHPAEPHPPRQPGAALASRDHLPARPTTTTSCCSRRRRPPATTCCWSPSASIPTRPRRPTSRCRCGSGASTTAARSQVEDLMRGYASPGPARSSASASTRANFPSPSGASAARKVHRGCSISDGA